MFLPLGNGLNRHAGGAMDQSASDRLNRAVTFHGHLCPGLVIGLRAVEAVMAHPVLGQAQYGKLVCITENDACGVDAIQCLLGCSAGKGNLVARPRGKQAYSFFDRENGTALRLCLRVTKNEQASREEWQQTLMSMPLEDMFSSSVPGYEAPERPRIFTSMPCEICGEGVAEPMLRLEDGKKVCQDCHRHYPRRW